MLLKSLLVSSAVVFVSADTISVTSTRDYRLGITDSQSTELAITKQRVGSSEMSSGGSQTTAITSCHFHGSIQFCIDGEGNEGSIDPAPSNTEDAPSSYIGCHSHGDDTFCLNSSGDELQFKPESESLHNSNSSSSKSSSDSGTNNLETSFYMLFIPLLLYYLV